MNLKNGSNDSEGVGRRNSSENRQPRAPVGFSIIENQLLG